MNDLIFYKIYHSKIFFTNTHNPFVCEIFFKKYLKKVSFYQYILYYFTGISYYYKNTYF